MLAHFSHHLIAALLQPLLPFIRDDFALDYTQAAWIVSAYTLAYGFSQLPGGWLADRIGVLVAGRLTQVGRAEEIFSTPGSREVAKFVGTEN
ncbi:MAG: MFS transporter, partial [Dehalococcoidales bacterium]|nr:MFS transporter [Dehalococcoidales bacterium]